MDVQKWIELAFEKVQTTAFYEKSNLIQRQQVIQFSQKLLEAGKHPNELTPLEIIESVLLNENDDVLYSWLNDIHFNFYPKQVVSISASEKNSQIISNKISSADLTIKRLAVFSYFPIELQIIDALWVLLYGVQIDNSLQDSCRGNRLATDKKTIYNRKWLYKKYIWQYKDWLSDCIEAVNTELKKQENDVSIVSLDVKDYYHSVRCDLKKYANNDPYVKPYTVDENFANAVMRVFLLMHQTYWKCAKQSGLTIFDINSITDSQGPLPIGLLSSPLLANDYLSPLDTYIKQTYQPTYYGRYVDDILIVKKQNIDEKINDVVDLVNHLLPDFLEINSNEDGHISFAPTADKSVNKCISYLCLQKEKVCVYNFDYKLPPQQIEKFEKEQFQRSSEFRFYTEDEDVNYFSWEKLHLVNVDMNPDQPLGRFKVSEDNKFKLSIYLTKSIQRICLLGKDAMNDEIDIVHDLFRGKLLLDYYTLWERVFSLFIVAERVDYAEELYENISSILELTQLSTSLYGCLSDVQEAYLTTVRNHLKLSLEMAYSLRPDLVKKSSIVRKIDVTRINKAFMSRTQFSIWPLQNLMHNFSNKGVAMSMSELRCPNFLKFKGRSIPYNVKWSDLLLAHIITNQPINESRIAKEYVTINKLDKGDKQKFMRYIKSNTISAESPKTIAYKAETENSKPNNNGESSVLVALANIALPSEDKLIITKEIVNPQQADLHLKILDGISRLGDIDILVLPEMALPYALLRWYCSKMANERVALISGLEYLNVKNVLYNKIITIIPMQLFGVKDAQIIIRDKNYYAPKEKEKIVSDHFKYPTVEFPKYYLLSWKNHIFTTYYCYELTNVLDRTCFLGHVDAIYAPVCNKDTYYFSNIMESMVRDMSCYMIQCNAAKYGDTRITWPTKHDEMTPLSVKGGTDGNNKVVLMTGYLDIKKLRDEQRKRLEQDGDISKDLDLKPLPPQYTLDMLESRENNSDFINKAEE